MVDAGADPHHLDRFVQAQAGGVYARALHELRQGSKRSHWMWFIFPQLRGLGTSSTSTLYGLSGPAEARALLQHPVLGARLRESCAALLDLTPEADAGSVLGEVDAVKLRSSMTLFAHAAEDEDLFSRVLDRFFDGPDERTLEMLGRRAP